MYLVISMFDILLVLQCLNGCMDSTSLKRLKIIIPALLAIPGRVTMLAISRWTGEGGSYRSVHTKWRISLPLITEQMIRPNEETIPEKTTKKN